jgi:hypothetical protein
MPHHLSRQVERTRFRIPLYFLTEESEHFQQFFQGKDLSGEVHISEEGVTSSAFASFIRVLRPRYGCRPPVSHDDAAHTPSGSASQASPRSTSGLRFFTCRPNGGFRIFVLLLSTSSSRWRRQ